MLLQAYYALFHSHISYCSQAWGQPTPDTNRICTLQNKAARLMTFSHYRSPAPPLFSELNLLRFADLIQVQNISLVQKIHINPFVVPPAFMALFNFDFSHSSHKTRGLSIGLINKSHHATVKYGFNSIKLHCINSWNSFLPQSIEFFRDSRYHKSKKSALDLSYNSLKTFASSYFIDSY